MYGTAYLLELTGCKKNAMTFTFSSQTCSKEKALTFHTFHAPSEKKNTSLSIPGMLSISVPQLYGDIGVQEKQHNTIVLRWCIPLLVAGFNPFEKILVKLDHFPR